MVQYGMRRYHAVQYSTARYDAIRYDSIGWCGGMAAGMVQCGMVWYNTIRYVQYTVRYNRMRFGMIGASGCRCIAGIGTLTTETSDAAAATGLSSGASSSAAASPHQRDCSPPSQLHCGHSCACTPSRYGKSSCAIHRLQHTDAQQSGPCACGRTCKS